MRNSTHLVHYDGLSTLSLVYTTTARTQTKNSCSVTVILYWQEYKSEVCSIGLVASPLLPLLPLHRSLTADRCVTAVRWRQALSCSSNLCRFPELLLETKRSSWSQWLSSSSKALPRTRVQVSTGYCRTEWCTQACCSLPCTYNAVIQFRERTSWPNPTHFSLRWDLNARLNE